MKTDEQITFYVRYVARKYRQLAELLTNTQRNPPTTVKDTHKFTERIITLLTEIYMTGRENAGEPLDSLDGTAITIKRGMPTDESKKSRLH